MCKITVKMYLIIKSVRTVHHLNAENPASFSGREGERKASDSVHVRLTVSEYHANPRHGSHFVSLQSVITELREDLLCYNTHQRGIHPGCDHKGIRKGLISAAPLLVSQHTPSYPS